MMRERGRGGGSKGYRVNSKHGDAVMHADIMTV